MPSFSKKSAKKLSQCDDRLQRVFNEVIKHRDCTILEGSRDKGTQDEYFRTGKSKVKYPNSKHNTLPSQAIDVAPYFPTAPHIRWDDIQSFAYFAGFVIGIAASMGITLRHGADWDQDGDTKDQSFMDWPHFELVD
tara:strand:- start:57304 stop:57711 length:408 start_codon:yes stop_codon:yes gene_type:complete